jgi:hypothetical protein
MASGLGFPPYTLRFLLYKETVAGFKPEFVKLTCFPPYIRIEKLTPS